MKSLKYGLILGLILSTTSSWAIGTRGGGKGVVCRDVHNAVQTVELLDLWEARNLHGQQIVASSGNAQKDLDQALERSKYIFATEDERVADWLRSSSQSIFVCTTNVPRSCPSGLVTQVTGVDLPLSNDSFEGALNLPSGCKVEQIIEYQRPASVGSYHYIINMDLVLKMDAINRTALSFHEGVYQTLVSWDNDQTSQRVRRIVGHIMSGGTFSTITDQLKKPYVHCSGSATYGIQDFYFMQDPKAGHPKVNFVAEGFAGNQLINFNENRIDSSNISSNVSIEDFYKGLKLGNFKMNIQGDGESIEFLTALRFEANSIAGTLYLDALTGGGPMYAPIENVICDFVK